MMLELKQDNVKLTNKKCDGTPIESQSESNFACALINGLAVKGIVFATHECRNANVSFENSNASKSLLHTYVVTHDKCNASRGATRRESKLRSTQWPHWMRRRWVIEGQYGTELSAGTQGGINQFSIKQNIQYISAKQECNAPFSTQIYANIASSASENFLAHICIYATYGAYALNICIIFLSRICFPHLNMFLSENNKFHSNVYCSRKFCAIIVNICNINAICQLYFKSLMTIKRKVIKIS